MEELAKILATFTPSTYGIWTGVLMFAGWWLREWRETRKLSADDRLARREGYAKQVEGLQQENRALRADLLAMEQRHDQYRALCHAETDGLRQQVVNLQNEVAGLLRQLTAAGIAAIRGEPGAASALVQAAADRTAGIMGRKSDGQDS